MKNFVIFLSSLCLLSACSQHHDVYDPNDYPLSQVPTDGLETSKQLLDTASVYCENNNCPSSVALLAMGTNSMAGSCTSFLISSTLALTNSHCVPNEVRTKEQSPADTMKLLFPSTGVYAAESVTVAEVIFFSTINPEDSEHVVGKLPDYALLRLSQPINDRQVLTLSREGMPDNLPLYAYSVTPASETTITGSLGVKNCVSVMNSAMQPSYTNAFTSVITFTGCEIAHGNSGSPLVDAEGNVRGILQASIDKDSEDKIARALQLPSDDYLNIGTNISCLDLPGVQTAADAQCAVPIPQLEFVAGIRQISSDKLKDPATIAQIQSDLNSKFADWQRSPHEFQDDFHWALTSDAKKDQFFPVPECYSSESVQTTYTLPLPRWTLQATFDSRFRFSTGVTEDDNANLTTLNLAALPNGYNPIAVTYQSGSDVGTISSVPYCGNARLSDK